MTPQDVQYAQPAYKKPKPLKKLNFQSMRKGAMFTVSSKTKDLRTTKRDGTPLVGQEGQPQVNLGVKFQEMGDQWFNIYANADDPLLPRIQRGDKLSGSFQGRTFYLQGVESGGQPPQQAVAQPVQTTPNLAQQQAPVQQATMAPKSSDDDKMRSKEMCIRGDAIQAAALSPLPKTESEIYELADRFSRYILVGSAAMNDDDIPF